MTYRRGLLVALTLCALAFSAAVIAGIGEWRGWWG
jgi:hypothetical protein